jgi:acetyltransferase-like isoleucine patch superfamily enzyme
MSAVVLKDVPPDTVVVGNPAKKLRNNNPPNKKEHFD